MPPIPLTFAPILVYAYEWGDQHRRRGVHTMHELSIALNLVEIAEDAARAAHATRVSVVRLRLGEMAGVVKDALFFAYDIATQDTLLAGSRLEIEDVPLVIYCATCATERQLPSMQLFACPVCGMPSADVRQGRELEIVSLEIEQEENTDEAPTPATETRRT